MVATSLAILSSSSSSFPANWNAELPSTSTSLRPTSLKLFESHFPFPKFASSRHPNSSVKVFASSSSSFSAEDGSVEKFLGKNSMADFSRFRRSSDGGSELQTAIVSYKKRFPLSLLNPFFQVDLVSSVHIADKEYFETLQKELASYDCVLYELVTNRESLEKGQNTTMRKMRKLPPSRDFSILGFIQRQMARILMLDFQDSLDYETENWYHADLDFETFELLQREKGESIFSFASDMNSKSIEAMVQPTSVRDDLDPWKSKLLWASRTLPMPLVGLLIINGITADVKSEASEALSRLDFGAAMKIFLAKELTSEFTQDTTDLEEKSVIIGERNRAATRELRKAINEGRNKIALLYGGGHMPDLGRRLRDEFELIPFKVKWVTAWSIKKREPDTNSLPFLKTMAEVSGWPLNRYQMLGLLVFSSVLAVDLLLWELLFGTTVDLVSDIASEIFQQVDNIQ